MGIYRNENVKSLPEQVQENKENIKQINEILENIDPEQVATILSDIQALKAEQVVQNTAIGSNTQNTSNNTTAINNEKTTRESVVGVDAFDNTYLKTASPNKQIIIENDGSISLKSNDDNVLILHPNGLVQLITADAVVECNANEGVKIKANDSSENPYELALKNTGDFEVKNGHALKFDTTGALTIDGQPIGGGGGGSQLYRHCITINQQTAGSEIQMSFDIISSSNEVLNTKEKIATYLNTKSLNSITSCLSISGYYYDGYNMYFAVGIFALSTTNLSIRVLSSAHSYYDIQIPTANIYDNVITL